MLAARSAAPPSLSAASASLSVWQLWVLLIGAFMTQFDFFVVNVAAPSIQDDLSTGSGQLALIVAGYAFAYASGLVVGGRLGDTVGHRRILVLGLVAFAVTSAGCGVSPGPGELIVARLLQGASAALLVPQVLAIISTRAHGADRARAMAWFGVAGGVGSLAGQVLGGFLVSADVDGLGWRLVFLVNLPIGIAGAVAACRALERDDVRPTGGATLDFGGAGGLATAVALFLVPLTLGHEQGWPAWTWTSMAVAVPTLIVTLAWERSLETAGRRPLLPLHLFEVRSFFRGLTCAAAFMAAFASYMFALAQVLQVGYGLDAFHAGLAFAPAALCFLVAALLTPKFPAALARHALAGGAILAAAALVGLAVVVHADSGHHWMDAVVPIAALVSLGNGAVYPQLLGTTLTEVSPSDAGVGAGALATAQQFAAAAGVAILGTVFLATAGSGLHPDVGAGMAWVAGSGAVLMLVIAGLDTAPGLRRPRRPVR
jgi:predicted MFS family arabinose efflux permease